MNEYQNTSEAYLAVIADIIDQPDYVTSPRGMKIYEKSAYSFRVKHPTSEAIQTHDSERNRIIADYTKKEAALYDSHSVDVADFAKTSAFWTSLANPDGTINSSYGNLLMQRADQGNLKFETVLRTPWHWALQSLLADRDTRQAILRFNRDEHLWKGNKDVVCTMYGIFHVRDGALNLTMHMRSNDAFYGLVYDMPWFCSLIARMQSDLAIAGTYVNTGTYTHIADSLHVYERNINAVAAMLGRK